jgi:hypothetical protein
MSKFNYVPATQLEWVDPRGLKIMISMGTHAGSIRLQKPEEFTMCFSHLWGIKHPRPTLNWVGECLFDQGVEEVMTLSILMEVAELSYFAE